jgi:hypothetical protein
LGSAAALLLAGRFGIVAEFGFSPAPLVIERKA